MSYRYSIATLLALFLLHAPATFGGTFFDFNEITTPKNKKLQSTAIDEYMDRAYGSNVSMGPRAQIGRSSEDTNVRSASSNQPNLYVKNGKGKNSGVSFSFGTAPISSFGVDSQIFRKGSGFLIKADGAIVYQHVLTKTEKQSGLAGRIDPIFFDKPVHTLEFIGLKKSKIGIDNLAVNFTLAEYQDLGKIITGAQNLPTQITVVAVPEPPSMILLGLGFLAFTWLSRRRYSRQ